MLHTDHGTTDPADGIPEFMGLVGRHPTMLRVYDLIRRIGPSSSAVLITGESGTGKELVAKALHLASPRAAESHVAVHCGAIPEDLLESELFGHVKGAFTGALAARTGRFRLAHGGTIFLDEIGEMSARFQVKLLRVLEEGTFEPVGSTTTQRVDVRVVAATHRNLHALAREGLFRADLLYRLDVVAIHLPALRERREDVPLLARHFLRRLVSKGFAPCTLAPSAERALMDYDWPGNVRELRNVLERAVLLNDGQGVLDAASLPAPLAGTARSTDSPLGVALDLGRSAGSWPWDFGPEGTNFYDELETFERRMIGRALQLAGGSKREAARLLQVNRTTLLEKLKRKGWDSAGLAGGTGSATGGEIPTAVPAGVAGAREGASPQSAPISWIPDLAHAGRTAMPQEMSMSRGSLPQPVVLSASRPDSPW